MMKDVKFLTLFSPLCVTAALLGVGCAPKPIDPEQMRALHEQNAALRQEISQMEAMIQQAGDDVPDLPDKIAEKEAAIASMIKQLDELDRHETDYRLRTIELQERLDTFRAQFRRMQDEIANSRKS